MFCTILARQFICMLAGHDMEATIDPLLCHRTCSKTRCLQLQDDGCRRHCIRSVCARPWPCHFLAVDFSASQHTSRIRSPTRPTCMTLVWDTQPQSIPALDAPSYSSSSQTLSTMGIETGSGRRSSPTHMTFRLDLFLLETLLRKKGVRQQS